MALTAGYSSVCVFLVQSPVAAAMISGLGADMLAISTLLVSKRRLAAFSQIAPPCMMSEIMLTGAANWIRSSMAASEKVWVPPPLAPVAPIICLLTSDRKSVV